MESPWTIIFKKDKKLVCRLWNSLSVWSAGFEMGTSHRHLDVLTWVLGRGRSLKDRYGNPLGGGRIREASRVLKIFRREHEEWNGVAKRKKERIQGFSPDTHLTGRPGPGKGMYLHYTMKQDHVYWQGWNMDEWKAVCTHLKANMLKKDFWIT